jgi:hypothetical protein
MRFACGSIGGEGGPGGKGGDGGPGGDGGDGGDAGIGGQVEIASTDPKMLMLVEVSLNQFVIRSIPNVFRHIESGAEHQFRHYWLNRQYW